MMKVIWKMRKHSSWFVWFFVTFLKGILSFDISHHRCMLHCHCFVVVVLILWHHIFHLIHLQYKFPCKSGEDHNFLKISLKSVHSLTPTCFRSKGKLHEIYHLETASYGFFLGHLFVSMKRQWLIKLKYVWLAINFQKTMQWKVFCYCAVTKRSRKFLKSNFIRSFTLQPFNP